MKIEINSEKVLKFETLLPTSDLGDKFLYNSKTNEVFALFLFSLPL